MGDVALEAKELELASVAFVVEARHLRDCPSCRSDFVSETKQAAGLVLDEVEHDMGRDLTEVEQRIFSRTLLVYRSLEQTYRGSVGKERAAIDRDMLKKPVMVYCNEVGEA